MGEGGGGRGGQGPVAAGDDKEEDGDAAPAGQSSAAAAPPPPPRGGSSWAGCRHAGAGLFETAAQYWATLMVFMQHTVFRWDTYFVCCANLASTLFYVYFEPSGEALVANLNLSFVSFIIIMPVTALITHAFTRREFSYQSISRLKGVSPHAAAPGRGKAEGLTKQKVPRLSLLRTPGHVFAGRPRPSRRHGRRARPASCGSPAGDDGDGPHDAGK